MSVVPILQSLIYRLRTERGRRITDGTFSDVKDYGYWWSSTENSATNAWGHMMSYNYGNVGSYNRAKQYGMSVHCVKD